MARVPMRETASVILNGAGAGTAKIGPISARETWYPSKVSVSANNVPVNDARCIVSVGNLQTKNFRDACIDGSTGDSTGNVEGDVLRCGDFVWADWSGGDAGVTATLTVTGEKEV